tara:strand:+ start:516 stop:683 length:168 start_codon:yes stop_codon:yes gene_type:complete
MDNLTNDDIRDIAIRIVDNFVANGLVKDCTDTNDDDEFEFQDIIFDVLKSNLRPA